MMKRTHPVGSCERRVPDREYNKFKNSEAGTRIICIQRFKHRNYVIEALKWLVENEAGFIIVSILSHMQCR